MSFNSPLVDTRRDFTEDQDNQLRPSAMNWEEFWARFGGTFEHSPELARRLYDQGLTERHDTVKGLHDGFCQLFRNASKEEKLHVVNQPPDLAGKLLRKSELSKDSMKEQTSAGLNRLTDMEFERFMDLNSRYRARFGFPFIMSVKNRDKKEILAAFEIRINNSPERELEVACGWIERIVLLRLQELFATA